MLRIRLARIFRALKLLPGALGLVALLWCYPAAAQPDPRWGVLAELAERDLSTGDDDVVSFRWKIPDKVIEIKTFSRDFISGVVAFKPFYYVLEDSSKSGLDKRSYAFTVRALPNGDLVQGTDAARVLWRESSGSYIWRPCATGGCGRVLKTDIGPSKTTLARVLARGSIEPGKPDLILGAATGASSDRPSSTDSSSSVTPTGAKLAATQADPRWGLLAEMAERDWKYSKGKNDVATARWDKPGERLVLSQWYNWGIGKTIFERDPRTGVIKVRLEGWGQFEDFSSPVTVSNAQIAIPDWPRSGPLTISKNSGGSVRFQFPAKRSLDFEWTPLLISDPGYQKLDREISLGAVRRADPNLNDSVMLASTNSSGGEAATAPAAAVSTIAPAFTPIVVNLGPRLALVIGNSAYAASMGQLPNPANDAGAMAQALGALGFQVTLVKNADQKAMRRAISDFGQRLAKAGPGSTGLFFYAGHGIQAKGINYLIPTDANIQTQADVEMEAVGADAVLEQMEEARASTNIVILDACRNMPLVRGFRSPTRGLAPMDAPNGSFIAYSTAPGSVAADGLGANSPFVSALVRNLSRKGESIEAIFRDVRREVLTATEGTQTPWDSSSLIQPFYFAGK